MHFFYRAIMAGVMTGLGGAAFLGAENRQVGALLFSVGMFAALVLKLPLYIGRCPSAIIKKPRQWQELGIILLGNVLGAVLCGLFYGLAEVTQKAPEVMAQRMTQSFFSTLVRGTFCGMMIYTGAYAWRSLENSKPVGTLLAVTAFIVAFFENSIADAFYFAAAITQNQAFEPRVLLFMLSAILGNTLGASLLFLAEEKARPTPVEEE